MKTDMASKIVFNVCDMYKRQGNEKEAARSSRVRGFGSAYVYKKTRTPNDCVRYSTVAGNKIYLPTP